MNYLYGTAWHTSGRFPIDPLSAAEAEKKWATGPQVSVSAGDGLVEGAVPAYTLKMSANAEDVDLQRYDAAGSVVQAYAWQTIGGRLFLSDVTEYLYPDDGENHEQNESIGTRIYYFKPTGYARLRTQVPGQPAKVEEFTDVDVSSHWREPIGWGDWDDIGTSEPGSLPT